MAGRLTIAAAISRDQIETCQAELVGMLAVVDELLIRTSQAMRRSPVVSDVLEPAVDRLSSLRSSLRLVQREMNTYWAEQQTIQWQSQRGNR